MKKVVLAVAAFVFALSLLSVGTIATAGDSVKANGKIVSMDAAKGEMVFCAEGTKDNVTIKMDSAELKKFKAGDAVMVQYKPGTPNMGERMKKARSATMPVGC